MKMANPDLLKRFEVLAAAEGLLPVKVTPFYRAKVEAEVTALGHTGGPLFRCVYPTEERLNVRSPGEVAEFVDDRGNMPPDAKGSIVRKYENRVLFFPTDLCAAHCQYCFRTDLLSEQHRSGEAGPEDKLDQLITYLRTHPEIEEVILSGGDPLVLPMLRLKDILQRIREETSVPHIRIHTRALAFSPSVFGEKRCQTLADYRVRLVHHIVHPYELCDEVRRYCADIRRAGVRSYNQFPILRKVNDHVDVLRRLLTDLDGLEIRNLSIFIPDPIKYSAAFRVPLTRLFGMFDELHRRASVWVSSTRLVLDTPYGKVRRDDLKSFDRTQGIATFEREGHTVTYYDFPEALDDPGDPTVMLWQI